MAAISPVLSATKNTILWEQITENDTLVAFNAAGYEVESVQITGSFGSGNCSWTGSNDGTNYVILNNLSGSSITATTNTLAGVQTQTQLIKPSVPSGTSADIDVTAFVRKRSF